MPVKIGRTVFESETMVKKTVPEKLNHEADNPEANFDQRKGSRNCEKCSPHQRSKSKISNIDNQSIVGERVKMN